MAFEKKIPMWNAAGVEPPDSLKEIGFTAGYKPPAEFFNWFMYGISAAVKELQDFAAIDTTAMEQGTEKQTQECNTVLDAVMSLEKSGTFFAHPSSDCKLVYATDRAFVESEERSVAYLVFVQNDGDKARRTVLALSYGETGNFIQKRNVSDGKWIGEWRGVSAADVGAVATDGSTTMTDSLAIDKTSDPYILLRNTEKNTETAVGNYGECSVLESRNDIGSGSNRRLLMVNNTKSETAGALSDCLVLREVKNNLKRDYPIYHTANKPTPAEIGAVSMAAVAVKLPASGWSDKKQTVAVEGVSDDVSVIVTAAPASHEVYNDCAVRCSEQGNGTLTFTCTDVPTSDVTANVLILA